jgi:hypothetical protein
MGWSMQVTWSAPWHHEVPKQMHMGSHRVPPMSNPVAPRWGTQHTLDHLTTHDYYHMQSLLSPNELHALPTYTVRVQPSSHGVYVG